MTMIDKMFGHLDEFRDKDGKNYRFIRYIEKPNVLFCWHIESESSQTGLGIRPIKVDIDVLKSLGVWDLLSADRRQVVETCEFQVKSLISGRMENARNARKPKSEYAHIPREIRCFECDEPSSIAPGVFVKKAGLYCEDTDEERAKISKFELSFRCASCAPRRRGRQRNPLYASIPRTIKCSGACGKECALNAKSVYELTGGKKDAIETYVKEYKCRSCNPEWGSWLKGKGRGRKPNPENVDFPRTAKCTGCSKEIAIVPSNIRDKAKRMKVTTEHLIANYKCRSCGGVVRKKKHNRKSKTV